MGIRFLCPSCGKRINVKEQQAGLRGFCPKCNAGVDIPLESTIPSRREMTEQAASTLALAQTARANAAGGVQAKVDPLYELPTALWYALPPGSETPFGPIEGPGLAQWLAEGRVTHDSMVWREDWPEWRQVSAVWPSRSPAGARPAAAPPAAPMPKKPKAAKGESVAEPPAMSSGGGATSRGVALAEPGTLGGKAVSSPAAAVGSAAPAGGVYLRRRSNGAYLKTVVVLGMLVVTLGGVMIWVIMRDPPPVPKKKPDTSPSATGTIVPIREMPALSIPTPTVSPTATPPATNAAAQPAMTGS